VNSQGCNIIAAALSVFGRLEASSVIQADLFKAKLGQTLLPLLATKQTFLEQFVGMACQKVTKNLVV
jgi:hypothetical protein